MKNILKCLKTKRKKRTTLKQEEQFKKERAEVSNIINWKNEEEITKINKIFNTKEADLIKPASFMSD